MSGTPLPGDRIQWQEDTRSEVSCVSLSTAFSENLYLRRDQTSGIARRIRSLYNDKLYTDVRFVVGTSRGTKTFLLAHKAILAVGSKKFAEMLFGNASVSAWTAHPTDIKIDNISYEAFRNIVEYLYTDDVFFEDLDLALETLRGAKHFEIQGLVDRCESFMESIEISEENACAVFQMAISNGMDNLKSRCIAFIQKNTRQVINSQGFMASPANIVRTICKLQTLNLKSEVELFEAVVRWGEAQTQGGASQRTVLEPLLKGIRFLAMSVADFSSLMQKHPNILTHKETLDIILYLSNPPKPPDFSTLPSWCNKGENRCVQLTGTLPVAAEGRPITENKVTIPLRPSTAPHHPSSLKCILEMKCIRGRHQIKAVNLSFHNQLTKDSVIKMLVLNVCVSPSGFALEERLRIENSASVTVKLSRTVLARSGDIVHILAEALEAENYEFLQFDESSSLFSSSDFACSVASYPKNDRLFFISEVLLCPQAKRVYRPQNFRR